MDWIEALRENWIAISALVVSLISLIASLHSSKQQSDIRLIDKKNEILRRCLENQKKIRQQLKLLDASAALEKSILIKHQDLPQGFQEGIKNAMSFEVKMRADLIKAEQKMDKICNMAVKIATKKRANISLTAIGRVETSLTRNEAFNDHLFDELKVFNQKMKEIDAESHF